MEYDMYGESDYGSIEYSGEQTYSQAYTLSLDETANITEVFSKSGSRYLLELSTLSDSLVKSISTIKLEAVTLSEVFIRSISRFISDVFSGFEEILDTIQARGLEFVDNISATDLITRFAQRFFSDNSTVTDTISRTLNRLRSLFDSFLGFADSILFGQQKNKEVFDEFSLIDSLSRSMNKMVYDVGVLLENFSKIKGQLKVLSDTQTLTDSISRNITRIFSELLSLVERIRKYLNGNIIIQYIYTLRSTVFSGKYSAKNTSFSDKYEEKNTTYTDKYPKKDTQY